VGWLITTPRSLVERKVCNLGDENEENAKSSRRRLTSLPTRRTQSAQRHAKFARDDCERLATMADMGLELRIHSCVAADWSSVRAMLTHHDLTPIIRMIDGLPAFPDEVPDATWKELRVSLLESMVTLGRVTTGYRVVTWGTPDARLEQARNWVAYSVACASNGTIERDGDRITPQQFAELVGIDSHGKSMSN
jgi:hypothetical protein